MRSPITWGAAVAFVCGLTPAAWGQVEALPAATPVAAAPAAAAAPAQRNLWTFLCPTQEMLDRKKEKFCNSMFGQLINNSLKAPGALTGGVIPGCCPAVKKSDLLKPADSAEGAAARIKEDEANAKARRAAVRYLGTVDCRYWPEARDALVNSLRADKNECVRLEAAYSLGRGCCCNKVTMQALILTVTGSDADDNPQEPSERVRVAAEYALRRCLDCYVEVERVKEKPAEKLPPPKEDDEPIPEKKPKKDGEKVGQSDGATPSTTTSPYYQRVSLITRDRILAAGRKAIEGRSGISSVPPPGTEIESRSLAAIWNNAMATQMATKTASSIEPGPMPVVVETRPVPVVVQNPPQPVGKPRGVVSRVFEKAPPRSTTPTGPMVPASVVKPEAELVTRVPVLPPVTPPAAASTPVVTEAPAAFVPPPAPVQAPKRVAAPVVPVTSKAQEPAPVLLPLEPPAKPREVVPAPLPAPAPEAPKVKILTPTPPATSTPIVPVVPTTKPAPTPTVATPTAAPIVPVVPTTKPAPTRVEKSIPVTKWMETTKPAATPVSQTTVPVPQPTSQPRWVDVVRPSAPTLSKEELVKVYRESVAPSRREWAAEQLGRVPGAGGDGRVVQLLLAGANADPEPMVRVACLNSIHQLGIMDYQLGSILQRLKGDSDVRVKQTAQVVDRWLQDEVSRCVNRPAGNVTRVR